MSVQLTTEEKDWFFAAHLPHRLTLLRAFGHRRKPPAEWLGEGDIYRCLKDSALISTRLLLNALGLQGEKSKQKGSYFLVKHRSKYPDDITIDLLGGELADPGQFAPDEHRLLAGIYCRADKELAHLTNTFEYDFNTEQAIIDGSNLVVETLKTHLYDKLGRELPPLSTDEHCDPHYW